MTTLKIKRTHPDAIIPRYATDGAICFDLHAIDTQNVQPHPADLEAAIFRTGLAFEIPPGYGLKVHSRSGHGFKYAVRLSNSTGLIDSDYRGEVMVALRADGKTALVVDNGDRIAQAELVQVHRATFEVVEELSETARGEGGFGSTGAGVMPSPDTVDTQPIKPARKRRAPAKKKATTH
jgi:dUTP pyrophosphatase